MISLSKTKEKYRHTTKKTHTREKQHQKKKNTGLSLPSLLRPSVLFLSLLLSHSINNNDDDIIAVKKILPLDSLLLVERDIYKTNEKQQQR